MLRKESSARQRAYNLIQNKILSGAWACGTVVSELALSRDMGRSRTPIREAVRQLAIQEQHRAILLAVSGRGDEAKAILADHIRASCQVRMDAYDHWERERALNIASV